MTPPTPEAGRTVLMYAALHGVNIPGGLWLTEARVRAALQRLPASMTYRRIVGRPDSILLSVSGTTTEDDVRRAVSEAVGCRCVAILTTSASRIVDKAVATLRTLGPPVTPPYRITIEGVEWEWCLVLSSDGLPPGMPEATWLFERTPTVVAVTPLEGRALLARKRRFTPNGARITLGNRLLDPWQKVLDANGVTVSCLTSRTLNRVAEVVQAAARLPVSDGAIMAPTPERASVVVGTFDPARVFPPEDPLTLPLLRLMLATDDARYVGTLLVMTDYQVSHATNIQGALSGGQFWYLFRHLCLHMKEAHNALNTLVNCVTESRLNELLHGRPDAIKAMERFRAAVGPDSFITKVRNSIGSHYRQADIERMYRSDLAAGKVEGTVVACNVGGLSRFTITDLIALHLIDEAALGESGGGDAEFSRRCGAVTDLVEDLSTFVSHLVDALLKKHGVEATYDTIEVPPLLRAARDALEMAQETPTA